MSDRGTRPAGEDREIPPAPGPAASTPRDPFVPWSRAFLRHAALRLTAAVTGGLVPAGIADSLLHRLAGFLQIIMISLFLSFAIEPADVDRSRRACAGVLSVRTAGLGLCADFRDSLLDAA